MRILGLDVGEKTIGVAVSDALHFTAQGIEQFLGMKKRVLTKCFRNWNQSSKNTKSIKPSSVFPSI